MEEATKKGQSMWFVKQHVSFKFKRPALSHERGDIADCFRC
jgi:hypothetical protein